VIGRDDEAERYAADAAAMSSKDDFMAQIFWRAARARLHVAQGEAAEAVDAACEAVAIGRQTDALADVGFAVEVLAEALLEVGRAAEGRAARGVH
jgi:hypothetical protein